MKAHIPPIKSVPNKTRQQSGYKLYERRNSMKNFKINPLNSFISQSNSGFSPRKPEILSPSILDFPNLVRSPVTPLISDPFDRSGSGNHFNSNAAAPLNVVAEEKAIKEKGFFLHPSPSTTPRDSEPRLLPLFPTTSPRFSGKMSCPKSDTPPASETTSTSTKRSRRKKTFAELKEDENLILKERSTLKKKIASMRATFKEQRAKNENLKKIKLYLNLHNGNDSSVTISEEAVSLQNRELMMQQSCARRFTGITKQDIASLENCALLKNFFFCSMAPRFMVIPDMQKNAPMFKRLDARIKRNGNL